MLDFEDLDLGLFRGWGEDGVLVAKGFDERKGGILLRFLLGDGFRGWYDEGVLDLWMLGEEGGPAADQKD